MTSQTKSGVIKVSCKVKELSDYQFIALNIREGLGDELPTGEFTFLQEIDSQDLSIDHLTFNLVINDEYQLSFKGFVEDLTNYRGENTWRLTFAPKNFYQSYAIREFSGIRGLISNLSPYEILNSYDTDSQLENIKIYQNNISDYKCLINYLKSAKANLLYSFRFDGLYFVDLKGKSTQTINIQSIERRIPLTVRRSKFMDMKAETFEMKYNELTNVHYNNSVIAITSKCSKAYMNYLENFETAKRLEDKISYPFPDYMDLRAGDLVKFTGNEFESNNYVVTDNELQMTPGKVINNLKFAVI